MADDPIAIAEAQDARRQTHIASALDGRAPLLP